MRAAVRDDLWTPGPLPGACLDASDVFRPGQAVVWARPDHVSGGTRGVVVAAYQDRVRVRALSGIWAGATETYRWAQWAPVLCTNDPCRGQLDVEHGADGPARTLTCPGCGSLFSVRRPGDR